jgi:hypothetical protein
MRTLACSVGSVLVAVSTLVAQTDVSSVVANASARCAITDCILKSPVVNAPFSADATTTWQPPASRGLTPLRATARYFRDSAGRVRVEQSFIGQGTRPQHVILAPDVNSTMAYVLDPATRTVSTPVTRGLTQMMVGDGGYYQFVLVKSIRRFLSFHVVPDGVDSVNGPGEESLGESSIAGVRVIGTRFVTQVPAFENGRGERWVSPELKLVVYSRGEDNRLGVLEYALTNISRSDPQAELFDLPQGYKEQPFEFPLTWDGPYSPDRTTTK